MNKALFIVLLLAAIFLVAGCTATQDRLLLKAGTDKPYCSGAPYLASHYVDNYYNSQGLVDDCEMPPGAIMDFAFKQHNQTILSHTGTIKVTVVTVNLESHTVLQVLTSNDTGGYPEGWTFCGNIEDIQEGARASHINCEGNNLRFIRLINAPWSPANQYLDLVVVDRVTK